MSYDKLVGNLRALAVSGHLQEFAEACRDIRTTAPELLQRICDRVPAIIANNFYFAVERAPEPKDQTPFIDYFTFDREWAMLLAASCVVPNRFVSVVALIEKRAHSKRMNGA